MRRPSLPSPKVRHLWWIPGLAIAVAANQLTGLHGHGLVPILAFGSAPPLPVLLGRGQPHGPGQLPRRVVPLFNGLHHPLGPIVLALVAATGLLSTVWLVGALAWLSHIVIDWAMGDGLRSPDGYVVARSVWAGRPFRTAPTPMSPSAG